MGTRVLKNTEGVIIYSLPLTRIVRKALALVACTGLLVLAAGPAMAAVNIDAASWDGTTLNANGSTDKPKRGGGPVEVFDADTGASLGTANLPNNGNWDFSGDTCAGSIYATQDDVTTAPFPVSGQGCGGVNTPPTANSDSYILCFTGIRLQALHCRPVIPSA